MTVMDCKIPSCALPASTRGWCRKHYIRWWRHGDPLASLRDGRGYLASNGYRILNKPDHPLAVNGKVYEHRIVLFAIIGSGTHPCHWCNNPVTWMVDLEVDHVDGNTTNNTPANLVPSCHQCNVGRVLAKSESWAQARVEATES